jgi:hypothetical protein
MKEIAGQIHTTIETTAPQLAQLASADTTHKPAPDSWSKREILGHLIDSAANNHQRFVRAAYNVADVFPMYDPPEWVRIQQYNNVPWESLMTLWAAYNNHLAHVIECLPEDAASAPCNIGKEEPVSLEFVVTDYLRHLQHHLGKILGE